MRYQAFVRAAAGVLSTALFAGVAFAQTQPQPPTMTDTAPTPASDRSSLGAVIMMDQPVLAQREQMQLAQDRASFDTRSMGAGPVRMMSAPTRRDELRQQRAMDELTKRRVTPQ